MPREYTFWSEYELAQVRRLRAEGRTLSEIATAVGRTYAAIKGLTSRGGFPLGPRRVSDAPVVVAPPREVRPLIAA